MMPRSSFIRPGLFAAAACLLSTVVAHADETVAYYRFEEVAPGQSFGDSPSRNVLDSSSHAYHLCPSHNPTSTEDVPEATISRIGEPNTRSAHFTGVEDIYSSPGKGLSRVVFDDFTIEVWVKFDSLEGWQSMVGRDDAGSPGEGIGPQSLFYLSKISDTKPGPGQVPNALRVDLITRDNHRIMIDSAFKVTTQTWYHVAAVGDVSAGTLTLFVNGEEIGRTTGYTGLFTPSRGNAWTLGRGQYAAKPLDFLRGYLDEVRFSNQALVPRLFLNAMAPPPRPIAGKP